MPLSVKWEVSKTFLASTFLICKISLSTAIYLSFSMRSFILSGILTIWSCTCKLVKVRCLWDAMAAIDSPGFPVRALYGIQKIKYQVVLHHHGYRIFTRIALQHHRRLDMKWPTEIDERQSLILGTLHHYRSSGPAGYLKERERRCRVPQCRRCAKLDRPRL